MTNDKETIQDIINQLEVLQKEAFKKNKSEKNLERTIFISYSLRQTVGHFGRQAVSP